MTSRIRTAVVTSLAVLALGACTSEPTSVPPPAAPDPTTPAPASSTAPASPTAPASGAPSASGSPSAETTPDRWPALQVDVLVDDLTLPWDVAQLADGNLIMTNKESGTITLVTPAGETRGLSSGPQGHWSSGETGLMGIAVDPSNPNRFVTCGGYSAGGTNDVRVIEWTLDAGRTAATEGATLIDGITASSGRHGGCRVLITEDDELYVTAGDAAIGTLPQDLSSLNGKVLRVDAATGEALPDNPFVDTAGADPRVFTYGHRNIQGITQGPDGAIWTAEHGPDVDDEVNRIVPGGNYGWNPVPAGGGEGYNESVPMTDDDLDGEQVPALWSTGDETLAIAGLDLITGAEWGNYAGTLMVATLKAQRMVVLPIEADGSVGEPRVPQELTDYGRLRSVLQLADGSVVVTTSNGSGDQLLRVTPA